MSDDPIPTAEMPGMVIQRITHLLDLAAHYWECAAAEGFAGDLEARDGWHDAIQELLDRIEAIEREWELSEREAT